MHNLFMKFASKPEECKEQIVEGSRRWRKGYFKLDKLQNFKR